MNDEQIDYLKKLMKDGNTVAWYDGQNYREIVNIVKKIVDDEPDTDEMAGVFNDGKWIDLYNIDEFDVVMLHVSPIFPVCSNDKNVA